MVRERILCVIDGVDGVIVVCVIELMIVVYVVIILRC